MLVLKALHEVLAGDTDVTDITTQIFSLRASQNATYPYAVIQVIANVPSPTKITTSKVDAYRVQISCFAKMGLTGGGLQEACELDEAIRNSIDGYRGCISDIQIDGVRYETTDSSFEDDNDVYHVFSDYHVRVAREGKVL